MRYHRIVEYCSTRLDQTIFARANDHVQQLPQGDQPAKLGAQFGDESVAEGTQRVAARADATRRGTRDGRRGQERVHPPGANGSAEPIDHISLRYIKFGNIHR